MMETIISYVHTSLYIPAIQRLAFHLPLVHILGTNHCGNLQHTALKWRKLFQDVICCRDYYERRVARFYHQIQLEYYGGNRSVSIEGIVLEHFSALSNVYINSTTPPCQCHTVFHSFYLTIANNILPLLLQTSIV